MQRYASLALLLAVTSACGPDSAPADISDAAVAEAADAQSGEECEYRDFSVDELQTERDDDIGVFFATANSGEVPNQQRLTFDLYFPLGATDGPHSFDFSGENLADCHTCLTIRRDCDGALCSSGPMFSPQSGRVIVESLGGEVDPFEATFSNLALAQVEAPEDDPLNTSPIPGGATWCIEELTLDLPVP